MCGRKSRGERREMLEEDDDDVQPDLEPRDIVEA